MGFKRRGAATGIEAEVALVLDGIHSWDQHAMETLQEALQRLPRQTMYRSAAEAQSAGTKCQDAQLLRALFALYERFPDADDHGLWAAVWRAISLFPDDAVKQELLTSLRRRPMWKTEEKAGWFLSADEWPGSR